MNVADAAVMFKFHVQHLASLQLRIVVSTHSAWLFNLFNAVLKCTLTDKGDTSHNPLALSRPTETY